MPFMSARFIVHLFLLLAFVVLEVTFLSLARWQHARAGQAQALLNTPAPTFSVTGTWVSPTVSIVLDNQPNPANPSQSGWRLLTLFQPDEARALFLDRGWLPFPPNRYNADTLPCAPTSETPATLQVIKKDYPTRHGMLQGPTTTTHPNIYAFLAPQGAYPHINQTEYLLTTTPTCAATRALLPPARSPQRHQSYMLQWLGLALATPVLFASLWWSKRRRP